MAILMFELMACLLAFNQISKPPGRLECMAPPPCSHLEMEVFSCSTFAKETQANSHAFSPN